MKMHGPPTRHGKDFSAVEIKGLGKTYYSGFWKTPHVGLRSLDLNVQKGEIFGFIGPNGAGKTTTIKCMLALHRPTAGQVFLLGKNARDPDSRRKVGFLPERPFFYQHLTASEFLDFYARLFAIPRNQRVRLCGELLEKVDLAHVADVPLGRFSKGMLQRAGVAQALINEPELVILDEPMSGLDPLGRMLVRDIILEQRELGRTVFFSSHILSDVQSICDRVGLIVAGELKAMGRIDTLIDRQIKHVDCTIDVPSGFAFKGEVVARQGHEHLLRVPPEKVEELLTKVMSSGGRVIQVQPARMTLEQVLVEELGKTGKGATRGSTGSDAAHREQTRT